MNEQEAREARAEAADAAMRAAFTEIHGQDATRLYTLPEVKQIVYPLINCISSAGYRKHPEPEITDEIKQLIDELHGVAVVFGDMSPIGNIARRARAAIEAALTRPEEQ